MKSLFSVSVSVFLCHIASAVPTPLLSFSFERTQCLQNKFEDGYLSSYVGDLRGQGSVASCIESDGASSQAKVQSSVNIAQLKGLLGSNDFTMELWLQPQLNLTSAVPIVSFGRNTKLAGACSNNLVVKAFTIRLTTFYLWSSWYIEQQISQQSVATQGINTNANDIGFMVQSCRGAEFTTGDALRAPTFTAQTVNGEAQLVHLVVDLAFKTISTSGLVLKTVTANYTVNGVRLNDENSRVHVSTFSFDASSWDSAGFLNIFPEVGGAGDIHYFAIYNQILSLSAIQDKYLQKLPNSLPVVKSTAVIIQENGEVGDHSLQPEFYNSLIPNNELSVVTLSVHDLEDYAYGAPAEGGRPRVYVTNFPTAAGCRIYQLDGTEIVAAHTNGRTYVRYDSILGSYAVRVRPPLNQFSTAFAFTAVDGVTGLPAADEAWVDVIVTHVNKPPVAAAQAISVTAGAYATLELNGSDPDSAISCAVIAELPTLGSLYPAHVSAGVALGVGDVILGPPFQLQYIYTGPQDSIRAASTVGSDTFKFVLQDTEGRRSVPALVSVAATAAVFATPAAASADDPQASEDVLSSIKLFGEDRSSAPRALYMQIIETPKFGTLYDPSNPGSPLTTGTKITSFVPAGNYSAGLSVSYLSPADYFSTPTVAWDGTPLSRPRDAFVYRVVTADGAVSLPVTQYVHIRNINDPTSISFTNSNQVEGSSGAEMETVLVQPDSASGIGKVVIEGFNITDVDIGVDVIHATVVVAGAGTVTLNPDFLPGVDFNSAKYCGMWTSWSCYGDGTTTAMSFVGTPSAIGAVLNGMTYASPAGTKEAAITVTLHDGEGGDCLTNQQHGAGSIRSGCYTSQVTIKIAVQPIGGGSSSATANSAAPLMARLLYAVIGLVVCCVLVALRCYCAKRHSRKDDEKFHKYDQDGQDKPASVFTTAARSLYASLPTMSPARTKHRQRRGTSGGDNVADDCTAEDGYDEEACRTPPRTGKGKGQPAAHTPGQTPPRSAARTPPCTPGTPATLETPRFEGGTHQHHAGLQLRVRVHTVVHNRAAGASTPSRTVVISRDVTTPDGKTVTETTHITVPASGNSTRESGPAKATTSLRKTPPRRAFPELAELAERNSTGSLPGSSGLPDCYSVAPTPSSTASPRAGSNASKGGKSPSKHRIPAQATDRSVSTEHTGGLNSTGTAYSQQRASGSGERRSRLAVTGKILFNIDGTEIETPQQNNNECDDRRGTKNHNTSAKKVVKSSNTSKNSSSQSHQAENVPWTQHVHRSGRTFYYNAETGQSTWRKPNGTEVG